MKTYYHRIDGQAVLRLADRILRVCADGDRPAPECEVALLVAYTQIAEGFRTYPAATRGRRAWRFVCEATLELVRLIAKVGDLTEAQLVEHELANREAVAQPSPHPVVN